MLTVLTLIVAAVTACSEAERSPLESLTLVDFDSLLSDSEYTIGLNAEYDSLHAFARIGDAVFVGDGHVAVLDQSEWAR